MTKMKKKTWSPGKKSPNKNSEMFGGCECGKVDWSVSPAASILSYLLDSFVQSASFLFPALQRNQNESFSKNNNLVLYGILEY